MSRAGRTCRAGFSLIEVLVAVVVLSLGLLGLAAVFPTVVRQQTQALDSVQSQSLLRSVEESVQNSAKLLEPDATNPAGQYDPLNWKLRRGWRSLTLDRDATGKPWSMRGEWSIPSIVVDVAAEARQSSGLKLERGSGDLAVGRAYWDATLNPPAWIGGVIIPLSERLLPSPRITGDQPRYVWDMVAQRVDAGLANHPTPGTDPARLATYHDDSVRVVVFVRRLDPGIRVPVGLTLADVLLGRVSDPSQRRVPVAADEATGVPTLDGVGAGGSRPVYSTPQVMAYRIPTPGAQTSAAGLVEFIDLYATAGNDVLLPYAALVGQKLVDAFGEVHTVQPLDANRAPQVAPRTATSRLVQISPGLSRHVSDAVVGYVPGTSPDHINKMLYTPQIPVAVTVMTAEPWRIPADQR